MTTVDGVETDAIDLAIAAYRDDGSWFLQDIDDQALESVHDVARELRRYPGDFGALAFIAVDEDFFLLVRTSGHEVRLLLSDASAATDWELARTATDHLGLVVEDDEETVPAGDLGILADLGVPAIELGELCDDLADDVEMLPDEILSEVADRLGFGKRFDDLAGLE